MKKLHCLVLAMSMLTLVILSVVGCSNESETTGVGTQTQDPQTSSDETTLWVDAIPEDVNYGGYDFNIGWVSITDINEYVLDFEESTGDVVSEAVYKRNRLAEAKLNITLSADKLPCNWTDATHAIKKLILADDNTYDVYCSGTWFLFQCSINGYLVPVSNIPTLDTSNVWWDSEFLKMSALGSSTYYLLNGHINYVDDYACSALYFNKVMCNDLGLEYPYEMVRFGEWTYDKMLVYVNAASNDLDGNSKYNQNDRYGLIDNSGILIRILPAFGENIIIFDPEGNAGLNSSESFYSKVQKVFDTLLDINNNAVLLLDRKIGYEIGETIFPNGHSMFYNHLIRDMLDFRMTMEDDFGVVPLPKYDEAQKSYYSAYNIVWGTSYSVPITNDDLERTGWILEVMGYYSTDTIYPASIEVNVMTKIVRDDESAEMLQIIFDNKFYELGQWGTKVYENLCAQVMGGKCEIASFIEKNRKLTEDQFAAVKDYYNFSGK